MVQINFAQKSVNVKIVYYGPGMSGKTTNLEVVHQRAPQTNRGELTSISTDGDRTLFFDYMPLDLGTVAGMRTCFQVYTVPGQVYYNSTRKLVLQGVDGVIFIADSSASMMEQNLESIRNLEENLNEYGKSLSTIPHVIQWNKRDLPDALPVEELERTLNHHGAPTFEASANTGVGVFPTLKSVAANVLKSIMQETPDGKQRIAGPGPGAAAPAAAPAMGGAPGQPAPVPMAPAAAVPGMPAPPPVPSPSFAAPAPSAPAPMAPAAAYGAPSAVPQVYPAPPAHADNPSAAPVAQVPAGMPAAPSPGQMMQSRTGPAPVSQQTRRAMPASAQSRRQRPKAQQAQPQPTVQPKKGKGFSTGAFVLLAAGAGALLAWGALRFLT